MADKKNYNSDGRSAEDRTLDKFAELLIGKLETIQADWKKPWFTEGVSTSLPKNMSGREYNGMNSMMLMLHAEKEGFKLPVWATFDRITGLNYVKDKQGAKQDARDGEGNKLPQVSVNKGAKSFPVFITPLPVSIQKQRSVSSMTITSVLQKKSVPNTMFIPNCRLTMSSMSRVRRISRRHVLNSSRNSRSRIRSLIQFSRKVKCLLSLPSTT